MVYGTDNLCAACQRDGNDSYDGAPHHDSWHSFQEAIEQGCKICAMLWSSFSNQEIERLKATGPLAFDTAWADRSYAEDVNDISGRFVVNTSTGTLYKPFFFKRLTVSEKQSMEEQPQSQSCNTGSDESLRQAGKWVKDCSQHHEICRSSKDAKRILPSRLVNVGSLKEETVRVCNTANFPQSTRYVTLSHCWGTKLIATLNVNNLASHEVGITISTLPQTFRDAIRVTRFLCIQYIWIDSLCIIQDSKEDWQRESLRMDSVYSYSYCNIAATRSSDSHGGCFTERPARLCYPVIINQLSKVFRTPATYYFYDTGPYLAEPKSYWKDEIEDSVLLSRAWVFQERLLAPRVLHFASNQVFFECRQVAASELSPSGSRRLNKLSLKPFIGDLWALDKSSALQKWQNLISTYNRGALTYERDRFIAIAGLARQLKLSLDCRYLAGLWEYQLVPQLCWTYKHYLHPNYSSRLQIPSKSPSWSWASRPGEIHQWSRLFTKYHDIESQRQTLTVKNVSVITVDGDEMSEVVSGHLKVTAKLIPTRYDRADGSLAVIYVRNRRLFLWPDIPYENFALYFEGLFSANCVWGENDETCRGLVLKPTGQGRGQYRRVGCYIEEHARDSKCLNDKGDANEKSLMTEDLYEEYHEETDEYTFTII